LEALTGLTTLAQHLALLSRLSPEMETNNERISLFHPSFHVLTVFGLVLATEIVAKLISKFAASNEVFSFFTLIFILSGSPASIMFIILIDYLIIIA
jgi:hypothetical protein